MNRVIIAGLATVFTLTAAESARADEPEGEGKHRFGSPGFIISAERLLPLLSYESNKVTAPDGSTDTHSQTSIALMNNGPLGGPFGTLYNLPRLGFDWLPIENLTVGGATWFYTQLSATDTFTPANGASKSTDLPKVTYWGIAPRVGYIFPINHMLSAWPRIGVEYQNVTYGSVNGSPSQSQSQFSLVADAMLVISPWNHFGFMVGPVVDVPITGKRDVQTTTGGAGGTTTQTTSVDSALFQVGLSAGMLGHF
jgi:hypothetical protein